MKHKIKPAGYEALLGEYACVVRDSGCGMPIGWGFPILGRMPEAQFEGLRAHGELVCRGKGVWFLVTRWLTENEAIKCYGGVKRMEYGPNGGWKSTTYGGTKFTSRHMAPDVLDARADWPADGE